MQIEVHEKQKRIKYIRVLEKFLTRTMSLLRLENFNEELFKERTIKNFKDLSRAETMELNSPYYSNLKKFIEKVMFSIYLEIDENDKEDFFDEAEEEENSMQNVLLKEANNLQKEKNATSYKKDKHKHAKFDDGY
ncbi:MAG: hypothetical protein HRT40_09430 [Campylobacteraceae bacterium]|nr:hypothetical protein [Campylobacteraceae bacterium]